MKIFTVMYVNFEAISKETPVQKLKEKLENFQYFLCLLRCIAELVSVNFMIFSVFLGYQRKILEQTNIQQSALIFRGHERSL